MSSVCASDFVVFGAKAAHRMLPTVIAIPGALASRAVFQPLYSGIEGCGFHVAHVPYASTCKDLDAAAEATAELLLRHKQHQPTPFSPPVHFVTHGAGALVLRKALQHVEWEGQASRIVMLGPPNRGSKMARQAARTSAVWRHTLKKGIVAELGGIGPRFFVECGDPPRSSSVLIIAGTSGGATAWLPRALTGLGPGLGPHDGAVFVKETLLRTPHTLLRLPCSHLAMPMTRAVIAATTEFLSAPSSGVGLERAVSAAKRAQVRLVLPWLTLHDDAEAVRLEHNPAQEAPPPAEREPCALLRLSKASDDARAAGSRLLPPAQFGGACDEAVLRV